MQETWQKLVYFVNEFPSINISISWYFTDFQTSNKDSSETNKKYNLRSSDLYHKKVQAAQGSENDSEFEDFQPTTRKGSSKIPQNEDLKWDISDDEEIECKNNQNEKSCLAFKPRGNEKKRYEIL